MTRDDIIRMEAAAGLSYYSIGKNRKNFITHLQHFAALVRADEREACAKVCEDLDAQNWSDFGEYKTGYADAIRARGQDPMPLFDDWGMK